MQLGMTGKGKPLRALDALRQQGMDWSGHSPKGFEADTGPAPS